MTHDEADHTGPTNLPAASRLPRNEHLPDPFETLAGERVETPAEWEARREELKTLFRRYVYGYAPDRPATGTTTERAEGVLDGRATLAETTVRFPEAPDAPEMRLATFLPTDRDGDVPVVLTLNDRGNHAVVADDAVTRPPAAEVVGADERGACEGYWCVDYVLERGYGFATYHGADLAFGEAGVGGVRVAFDDDLPGPPGSEWGTLAAWAWGLGRCADVLESTTGVDADRMAVLGHSRCGKAALLAGATDERFGVVAPHQSGTGGVTLSRDNDQEGVSDITTAFPDWFADAFAAFGGQPERLPVDQHLLVSLVAPRGLVDTEGGRDYWSNPGRALDAIRAAAPVYELLGADGMRGDGLLHAGDPVTAETAGDLVQYRRETGHTLDRGYWEVVLDFADRQFGRQSK